MFEARRGRSRRHDVAVGEAVRRSVGYAPAFDYVAEVTAPTSKGFVTVREGGFTADGALSRAKLAARDRSAFAGFRRAAGYVNDVLVGDHGGANHGKVGYA